MIREISADNYYNSFSNIPLMDVRSPGEFAKGHIKGAVNIPLFTDEERAKVGTVYKQHSPEKAIELGYDIIDPKRDSFVSESKKAAPWGEVVVQCWRGGMRSAAFAGHLAENGFSKVYLIKGGYKAFRNYILSFFDQPFKLNILGGYTGSGKTGILHFLARQGEQVIDMEGLASHRGSAFGGIGLAPQPTVTQFENNLFDQMRKLDIQKPVWLEDESHAIGKVLIPIGLFNQIRGGNVYFLNIPLHERIRHLVDVYSGLNADELALAIRKITKRLGYDRAKQALTALEKKNYHEVAKIILYYYDKSYFNGLKERDASNVIEIKLESVDNEKNAGILINHIKNR